jgi:Tol biopolymer transport system component
MVHYSMVGTSEEVPRHRNVTASMMRARLTQQCSRALFVCVATLALIAPATSSTALGSAPLRASWSPDSTNVVFIVREARDTDALRVCKYDGSAAETHLKGERFHAVAWSPSGAHIAVASVPSEGEAVVQIVHLDRSAPDTIKLGSPAKRVALGWSADSSRIVVERDGSILLLNTDDGKVDTFGDVEPPVHRVFFDGSSPLSPDNKLLLAAGPVDPLAGTFGYRGGNDTAEKNANLYLRLVKVEGERYTLPVVQYGHLAGPPVWAPDGRTIAFMTTAAPPVGTATRPSEAFWMNVVSDVGTVRIDPKRVVNPLYIVPVWSPTGTNVCYFWRDPTGKCYLNIMNVAFTTVLLLSERFNRVLFASWNEEMNMFVVAVTADNETVCTSIDLASGELERLATVKGPYDRLLPSPDLTKLLLVTQAWGKPSFAVHNVETGEVVRLQ